MLQRYSNYIRNFESLLAKRFPKAMTVYRGFMDGVSFFYQDVKQFMKILPKVNVPGKSLHKLTRHELEIYERVPREMVKLAPVLIGSALPAGYMVLMPLAYLFPKQLMTEHFWTPEQKKRFGDEKMINRLKHSNAIIKLLTAPNVCIQSQIVDAKLWLLLQAEMKTKQIILPHKYIGCIDMFKGIPFHLDKMSRLHLMHLAKLHDVNTFWRTKRKLRHKAQLILAMDRAIIKEGGIKNLTAEQMRKVCHLRGLNAEDLDVDTMMKWLNKWMHISVSADENALSFLLHASAVLGYNAPANRRLLKSEKSALSKLRLNSRAALKRMTH